MTFRITLLALALASASCIPQESTHDLLSRLGFDPVQKPGVNYHKKRVAEDSDKARFGGHSEKDSHMFVVRLPPHHSYYSLQEAEKLENEVLAKGVNFPLNGKPAQLYHWNLPQLKKFAKHKKSDSKIVRLKIKPEEFEFYKKMRKDGKPNMYKLKKEHVMTIKELAEHHQNDRPVVESDSKFTHIRKNDDSKVTVVKFNHHHGHERNQLTKNFGGMKKYVEKSPVVYSPAIPKYNSFHKYFPGNGKPKSFYVIEKSEKPSRYHRLL